MLTYLFKQMDLTSPHTDFNRVCAKILKHIDQKQQVEEKLL